MKFARAAAAALSLAVIGTGAVGVPASVAADTDMVYACVKKSNGEVRIVTETKKCKSGWVKISWNVTGPVGPAGPVGPVGPNRMLLDAKGAAVGTLLSAASWGYFNVENDGGLYTVYQNGQLETDYVYYTDSKCMGAAYRYFDKFDGSSAAGAGNTWSRFVQQTPDKKYWGFAYTGNNSQVYLSTDLYYSLFPGGGSCFKDDSVNSGWLFTLKSVPAPQPAIGRVSLK